MINPPDKTQQNLRPADDGAAPMHQPYDDGQGARHSQPASHGHRHEGIGFLARLRAYFLAGALVAAPIAVTAYLGWSFVSFVDRNIRPLIPAGYNPEEYLPFSIPGIGLLVVVIALILIGAFTAGYLGRLALGYGEGIVARMPVVRGIYSAVKQIFQTVLANRATAFREVVMIEYPRDGSWSIGFVTAAAAPAMQRHFDEEMVHVFIPFAPPTAGYLVTVPRACVRKLDMTVEEGLKMVLSGGIVVPQENGGGNRAPEPPAGPR